MQVRYHISLVLVALLAGAALAATWNDKNLDNWDKGWDVNFLGEPIDPFCKPSTGDKYVCSDGSEFKLLGQEEMDAIKDNDVVKPLRIRYLPVHGAASK
ncbi:hypothetical protein BGZ58_007841 [Dissophora ornata]|nr:hypothetical protein BGZ58_007841 [Dissophora ornata]